MKPHRCSLRTRICLFTTLLTLSLIFTTGILKAQKLANFAGTWEFDKQASTGDLIESKYDGIVLRQITQNASTISFKDTWKKPGEQDFITAAETYYLDGKERVKKSDIGTRKNSATWSADKQILTIKNLDTQTLKGVPQDFLVTDSYTLSDGGRVLTIEEYSKNPVKGETRATKVYRKK